MGQTIGKASIHPGALPFVNLPKSTIDTLRQCVNEVAEGFGLSRDELKQIIHLSFQEYIRILDSTTLDHWSDELFVLFSSDAQSVKSPKEQNDELIDSFEFLATIFAVSSMQPDEKIDFIFDLFDVSECGYLSINEVTLSFRLLTSGAEKISSNSFEFDVHSIDRLVLKGFEFSSKTATQDEDLRTNKHDFIHFIFNCSETMSFLSWLDDIAVEDRPRSTIERNETKVNTTPPIQPFV